MTQDNVIILSVQGLFIWTVLVSSIALFIGFCGGEVMGMAAKFGKWSVSKFKTWKFHRKLKPAADIPDAPGRIPTIVTSSISLNVVMQENEILKRHIKVLERVIKNEGRGLVQTPHAQFLRWIADRFVNIYGVEPGTDYVISLRQRADIFETGVSIISE